MKNFIRIAGTCIAYAVWATAAIGMLGLQLTSAWVGLEYTAGLWGGIAIVVLLVWLRVPWVLLVFSFLGAKNGWGWPWWGSVFAAAPLAVLLLPLGGVAIAAGLREWLARRPKPRGTFRFLSRADIDAVYAAVADIETPPKVKLHVRLPPSFNGGQLAANVDVTREGLLLATVSLRRNAGNYQATLHRNASSEQSHFYAATLDDALMEALDGLDVEKAP